MNKDLLQQWLSTENRVASYGARDESRYDQQSMANVF